MPIERISEHEFGIRSASGGHSEQTQPRRQSVIGLGASFDTDLYEAIGTVIGMEGRAKHNWAFLQGKYNEPYHGLTFYAPNINIYRDPRWGRGQETTGEDPYLTGRYAVHLLRGLQQGPDPTRYLAIGCCKHFAAYSLENVTAISVDRFNFSANVTKRDLAETYLPAFKACIKEGRGGSVMCSYNEINGVPACANKQFMIDILRKEWGFEGFVVSDYGAVENLWKRQGKARDPVEAAALALNAGCDQEGGGTLFYNLPEAVKRGLVSMSRIDEAVRRLFLTRLRLGMFDPPDAVRYNSIPPSILEDEAHRLLALHAARQSIVLLKNENSGPKGKIGGGKLPWLVSKFGSIAVIGPNANATDVLLGNYHGSPNHIVSVIEGIKQNFQGEINFEIGCSSVWCESKEHFEGAREAVIHSDAVVIVAGICTDVDDQVEGESDDRAEIGLPGYQEELIQLVTITALSASKPVVLVLINGGPLALSNWTVENVPAIIEAFYPGEQGGRAIADVIFGAYNPAGRLPTTWYRGLDQLPPFTSMDMYAPPGRTYRFFQGEPLFYFGFGLSYTTFSYSDLIITPNSNTIKPCDSITLTVAITNSGLVTGDEVVQVYISLENSNNFPRPNIQLVGFTRLKAVEPNERVLVAFEIVGEQMSVVDDEGASWIFPGVVRLSVGGGQPHAPGFYGLQTIYKIVGAATPLKNCTSIPYL